MEHRIRSQDYFPKGTPEMRLLIQQYVDSLSIHTDYEIVRGDINLSDPNKTYYFWHRNTLNDLELISKSRMFSESDHIVTLMSGEKCIDVTPETYLGTFDIGLFFIVERKSVDGTTSPPPPPPPPSPSPPLHPPFTGEFDKKGLKKMKRPLG